MRLLIPGGEEIKPISFELNRDFDGKLGAGQSLSGEIFFQAEKSEVYELFFVDPIGGGKPVWRINVEDID